MTVIEAAVQLKSLRTQLDVLEARLRAQREQGKSFGELRGLLAGQSDSSPEDIDRVLFRAPREKAG